MEDITLTRDQLKHILNCATCNIKDFVMDEDGLIDDWIKYQAFKTLTK